MYDLSDRCVYILRKPLCKAGAFFIGAPGRVQGVRDLRGMSVRFGFRLECFLETAQYGELLEALKFRKRDVVFLLHAFSISPV